VKTAAVRIGDLLKPKQFDPAIGWAVHKRIQTTFNKTDTTRYICPPSKTTKKKQRNNHVE
jgi:hypothetical protein